MNSAELGKYGENLAVRYLEKKGHEVLARNYRFGRGEIDIISRFNGIVVITEVKTRNSIALGQPYQSVSRKKQQQLIKLSNAYIRENNIQEELRFDVISIIHNRKGTEINHIEGAFYPVV